MRVEFETRIIPSKDLEALAQAVLASSVPEDFSPLSGSTTYSVLSEPVVEEDYSASWKMQVSQSILAKLDGNQTINLVLGKPIPSASRQLADAFALEHPPDIQINPEWWPRLPVLPFRILVFLGG